MATLVQILEATISPDQNTSTNASSQLKDALINDLPGFLETLAQFIYDEQNSQQSRMAASMFLKNQLAMKDLRARKDLHDRWLSIDANRRTIIKNSLLKSLGTVQSTVGRSVAQAVSSIAQAELPHNQWPELIDLLLINSTQHNDAFHLQQATLETLGFICEEIEGHVLQRYANQILTALVTGITQQNAPPPVKLAAIKALLSSLDFIDANFKDQRERDIIMQTVCEATQVQNHPEFVEMALQCLVKIVDIYYDYLENYMDSLFAVTLEFMESPYDRIAIQAIEFWSTICDCECDLRLELEEAEQMGKHPEKVSKFYARGALTHLIEKLVILLTFQSDDPDDFTRAKGAVCCIGLLAKTVEDAILQPIFPFIRDNIKNDDWHYREAAVVAFGSILTGPSIEQLTTMCQQGLPLIMSQFSDPHPLVKDTAAWAMGKICETTPDVVLSYQPLNDIMQAFFIALDGDPSVCSHICWSLKSLVEHSFDLAQDESPDGVVPHFVLSMYYKDFVGKLLEITERTDATQKNLRVSAYDTLMTFCGKTPQDCYDVLRITTQTILQRLSTALNWQQQAKGDIHSMSHISQIQSLICATLSDIVLALEVDDVRSLSNHMVQLLLYVYTTSREAKQSDVQEDALQALDSIISQLEEDFMQYMPTFAPHIYHGLRNHIEDPHVCVQFCGMISDMSSSLKQGFFQYISPIMDILMTIIKDDNRDRIVNPAILACFADIATATGVEFKVCAEQVMNITIQAAMYRANETGYTEFEEMEYTNSLRESCMEVIDAAIVNLRGNNPNQFDQAVYCLGPYVDNIIAFLKIVAEDQYNNPTLRKHCLIIVGDLCLTFKDDMSPVLRNNQQWIVSLIQKGQKTGDKATKNAAQTCGSQLTKYLKN